jgi:hypothetical protein
MRTIFGCSVSHRIIFMPRGGCTCAPEHRWLAGWLALLACQTKALWEGGSRTEMEVEGERSQNLDQPGKRSETKCEARESPRAAAAAATRRRQSWRYERERDTGAWERMRVREKRDSSCAMPQTETKKPSTSNQNLKGFSPRPPARRPESCIFLTQSIFFSFSWAMSSLFLFSVRFAFHLLWLDLILFIGRFFFFFGEMWRYTLRRKDD